MRKYWVYVHTCPNGKKYVGCTTKAKPEYRWAKGRGYKGRLFEEAIRKYGWDNIEHEVFEVDSKEEMYRKEVELISFYHSNDPEYGYNNSVGGEKSALGCIMSEEARKHISEGHKKKWTDPEYRRKQFEAQKKAHSDPEYRKKLSEVLKGKTRSEETKRRIAEAAKKRAKNPEFRRKMAEIHTGKPRSEETKRRISKAMKGKPAWNKGKPHSEEAKRHMSEAKKGKPQSKVKISLPDGTVIEVTKHNLARNYINKGRKFEYVS